MSDDLKIKELYNAIPGSPITYISEGVTDNQTTIEVNDIDRLPTAPNIATLYSGNNFETIFYGDTDQNTLIDVERGLNGEAQEWSANINIARTMTAYDLNNIQGNLQIMQGISFNLTGLNKEEILPDPPVNPEDGDMWYDTTDNQLRIYDSDSQVWNQKELDTVPVMHNNEHHSEDFETITGAQSKADTAETNAKNYTDEHENKVNPHDISVYDEYNFYDDFEGANISELNNDEGYITSYNNYYVNSVTGSGDGTLDISVNGVSDVSTDLSHNHDDLYNDYSLETHGNEYHSIQDLDTSADVTFNKVITDKIGVGAESPGLTSIAIGENSYADGENSMAIGKNAEIQSVTGNQHDDSIVIGTGAKIIMPSEAESNDSNSYNVVIGPSAKAEAVYGTDFVNPPNSAVAVGYQAEATHQGTAIGAFTKGGGISLGRGAKAASGSIAIGDGVEVTENYAIQIGEEYHTVDIPGLGVEEFFLYNETEFEDATNDAAKMDTLTDANLGMELLTQDEGYMEITAGAEIAMDKVTDSEIAMDKVTDKEMPMDKVMSKIMPRDKFYNASHWADKGIYNRSDWANEAVLTENNWKDNKTFDQITDDTTLMDEFTDSEQSMDDSTNSEIAMDKVTDKEMPMDKVTDKVMPMDKVMSKIMPRDKFYSSLRWVDKGIYTRSIWANETVLTENDWNRNRTFDQITDDTTFMDEFTNSEQSMDDSTNSEIAMDKITDSEIAMDKVTDKEMPMDKVMSKIMPRDKFYSSLRWVDKGIYTRSIWANETVLTENNWNINKTFDQITDDTTLMDEFTNSEQSMDDSTNSEIAMDKITDSEIAMDKVTDKEMPMDKVTDKVMPLTKILSSPYNTSHLMAKNLSSEELWDNGFSDRDTGDVSYSLVNGDYGGYALDIDGTIDDYKVYLTRAILDLTNYNTIKFQIDYDNDGGAENKVHIDNTEVYSGEMGYSGSKEITLDISGYGQVEVGIGGRNRIFNGDTFNNTWHHIILEV